MITEALKAVSLMMSSTPLLTRMSLSYRFGRKHEVMRSTLIAHIHCAIHSEGCADRRSEVFLMKAVPETRTGRVPSNTRVLRPCSRITLRYIRKRQHTHGGRALCEPCGLGHSDRKTGRVGMLFSTWRPFFKGVLNVPTLSHSSNSGSESRGGIRFIRGLLCGSSTYSFMPALCFFVPGGP